MIYTRKKNNKLDEIIRIRENLEFPLKDVILMPAEFFQISRSIYIFFFYSFIFTKTNGEEVVAKFDLIKTQNFWEDSMTLTVSFQENNFSFSMSFVNGYLELDNEEKLYEDLRTVNKFIF